MTRVSWVDLLEKVVAGVGREGAGDPTVVEGVAACSHFSVSSLMLVEPAGDFPDAEAALFLSVWPMGSSLGRSFELVLEYFLSVDHLGLSACSHPCTILDRLDDSASAAEASWTAAAAAAASALELRRLQLNDLTVEAMLSCDECCDPFRLSHERRVFIASKDFFRSAIVKEEDLEAGFPNGRPVAELVRVDDILRLSLVTWAGGGGALSVLVAPLGTGGTCSDCRLSSAALPGLASDKVAGFGVPVMAALRDPSGECGGVPTDELCERDDRALDTAESLSESSDLIGGMATPLLLLLLPLTGWLPRPTDGVDVDV